MLSSPQLVRVERRPLEVRTPGSRFGDVRRVVVARDDRLGDLVLTLPAVAAIRSAYPSARLALWVRPGVAPLARMVDGVAEVIEAGDDRRASLSRLREFRADLIVCVSRSAAVAWAALRARIRHRVGSANRLYSSLFERRVNERRRAGGRHELEYALSFAHRVGAPTGPVVFGIRPPAEVEEEVGAWLTARRLKRRRYVVLHPGSGGSCPSWPVEHYVELAARLLDQNRRVVISIGPADEAAERAFSRAPVAVRELPRFDAAIPQLAVLAARAGVVVGNSTGPLHLAAAVGAPTLAFHAPWPTCGAGRWGPYADNGWALVAAAEGAMRWSRRERARRAPGLMAMISPDNATRCAVALLERRMPEA